VCDQASWIINCVTCTSTGLTEQQFLTGTSGPRDCEKGTHEGDLGERNLLHKFAGLTSPLRLRSVTQVLSCSAAVGWCDYLRLSSIFVWLPRRLIWLLTDSYTHRHSCVDWWVERIDALEEVLIRSTATLGRRRISFL
jgi:hypothetical protein